MSIKRPSSSSHPRNIFFLADPNNLADPVPFTLGVGPRMEGGEVHGFALTIDEARKLRDELADALAALASMDDEPDYIKRRNPWPEVKPADLAPGHAARVAHRLAQDAEALRNARAVVGNTYSYPANPAVELAFVEVFNAIDRALVVVQNSTPPSVDK